MKKILSVFVALMLLLACSASMASTQSEAAQDFMNLLGQKGIKYTDRGDVGDGIYQVRCSWNDDDLNITVNIFFNENGTVSYRLWNVVDCSCGLSYAYQVCNELNDQYKYAKFYVDTSDNSITVAADMELLSGVNCAAACNEMMGDLVGVVDAARDTLLKLK